ncbi:MAG: hypothetical protein JNJ46_17015 [Myxococcales bacterium]|nr:hypothetical protein [Myxococcales bacterium]
MRSEKEFVEAFARALRAVDPGAEETLASGDVRRLAGVELCLSFLNRFRPAEGLSAVPFLLLGFPSLLGSGRRRDIEGALAAVRHLCGRFASVSAWVEASAWHAQIPSQWRCYQVDSGGMVTRRSVAPTRLLDVLGQAMAAPVPWSQVSLRVASPGEARVYVDHRRKTLAYQVPVVSKDRQAMPQHELQPRSINPPLILRWQDLMAAARRVDSREATAEWPVDTLPRLHLASRLERVAIERVEGTLWDGEKLTIDGATHLVGMLSSGKSTLVWSIVFATAFGGGGRRIVMIVPDTIQGATITARLRRHGVPSTVLSSVRNREHHFGAIQWRHGLTSDTRSLDTLGDLTEGFGLACPLDGLQRELEVVAGEDGAVVWPKMSEKPCHRLYQSTPKDDSDESARTDVVEGEGLSCPLFAACPAQEQQRNAVSAQVVVMTPQAFVHMTPDRWTTPSRITLPELLQYSADLVIMDEVDSIQKAFDDAFAPRSPLMGDDDDVYAPNIGMRTSEALRARSGHQFRRADNARWQSNFHTLFRLIGTLYAILQREGESIAGFYRHAPFTSAGILGELWRLREGRPPGEDAGERDMYEARFVEVLKVASAIGRFSRASAVSQEPGDTEADPLADLSDEGLVTAGTRLRELARQVLTSDYYDDILQEVQRDLGGTLAAFDVRGRGTGRRDELLLDDRSSAAAILLAIVTELVLAHYNWLVRAQPGVAQDFEIDDGQLLSQANNLMRHYRTLLPSNPAGGVFGLFYDEPPTEKRGQLGGKLTLVNHLGVGRHLVVHLHDLLAAEGQAGPHVLMLSGTSWAGGSRKEFDPSLRMELDVASPTYDVQVPVRGVLTQPSDELQAIRESRFALCSLRDAQGKQFEISGLMPTRRRQLIAAVGERLATPQEGGNLLERQWVSMERHWGTSALEDRRRALLVVNSYADAALVADAVAQALYRNAGVRRVVYGLVRDSADDERSIEITPKLARPLPRSLVERFGETDETSVLVAPLSVIARGHNILNRHHRAAISTIYFLHRPHPRPDDLSPAVARLNRFAVEQYDRVLERADGAAVAGRVLRDGASRLVRLALAMRDGYPALSPVFKAQFAWDLLTPLWQTIGRGIRGGCPVYVGFIDAKFAPRSFDGGRDDAHSSVLVQAIQQLQIAMRDDQTSQERLVAERLYQPFHDALARTEGLLHG